MSGGNGGRQDEIVSEEKGTQRGRAGGGLARGPLRVMVVVVVVTAAGV